MFGRGSLSLFLSLSHIYCVVLSPSLHCICVSTGIWYEQRERARTMESECTASAEGPD